MNPQDNDPSSRRPSLYQMSTERERKGGGGGMIVLLLVALLLIGGGAYYFLKVYKQPQPAAAALPAAATPRPAVAAATPPLGYNSVTEQGYINQADKAWTMLQQPKKQAFEDALKAYNEAGGANPKGLNSKEAVTARRDLITKLVAANDDYAAFASTQDALYKDQLTRTPLTPADVDETFRGYQDRAKTPSFIKIREAEHTMLQAGNEMITALDKGYGNWSVSPVGKLAFKRPADSTEYNSLAQKYNTSVQALNKLQLDYKGTTDLDDTAPPAASPGASAAPAAAAGSTASPATPH